MTISLHGFVDDSASDVGDRRLFLAAYIHGAEAWISFNSAWKVALSTEPSIGYLKMSEAQNLRGQFRHWTVEDRNKKLSALAAIIEQHEPWSVYCSVSRDEHLRLLAPVAPYPLKNPYSLCFWGIIQTATDYHKQLGFEGIPPVDFVFDQQGGLGHDAALWYNWQKQSWDATTQSFMGAKPIFCDDEQVVALQAADMLAWHIRRVHEGREPPVARLLERIRGSGAFREVDAAALTQLAKKMRRVPGVWSVQNKAEWRGARTAARAAVDAGVGPPSTKLLYLHLLNLRMRVRAIRAWLRRHHWW